jgi:acyl dehydratase/putative sterol carrier protein
MRILMLLWIDSKMSEPESYIKPEILLNSETPPSPVAYNKRDLILYALGVGATDLRYTYEGDSDFQAIPTYSTCFPFKGDSYDIVPFGGGSMASFPGAKFNPAMILHGEQETEVLSHPIPLEGNFVSKSKVIGVYDKGQGKGAVIVRETLTIDAATNKKIFRNVTTIFVRGLGGFGGDRGPAQQNIEPPKRAPDAVQEDKTTANQALLYRLSGDYNPLHADPMLAQMVGFKQPILHGLCSYGYSCRAVLNKFCDNETKNFKLIKARFASPVFPGETLVTEMWKEGNRVIFVTKVKERNLVVINNACVELNTGGAAAPSAGPATLKSQPVFDAMTQAVSKNADLVDKVKGVFQFNLKTKDGQTVVYTADLKNKPGQVKQGTIDGVKPDCTLTVADEDYFDISTGKINAQQAFMQGKLKISGNLMLSQKLSLIQQSSKL